MQNQPPTEFEQARARRLVQPLLEKIALLPLDIQEQFEMIANALLVATDEEMHAMQKVMEATPLNIHAVIELARQILARNGVDPAS